MNRWAQVLLLLVPYPAMLLGLYVFHSAWIALLLYHALMLLGLGLAGDRTCWTRLVHGFRPGPAALLILGSAAVGPLLVLTWPWVATSATPVRSVLEGLKLTGIAWPAFAAYYALVHPGIEEAYWRGCVARRVEAAWLSDASYAGYHALVLATYASALATLGTVGVLVAAAAAWRGLDRKLGGLAVPWLSHLVADASFILGVWWLAGPGR